MEALLDAERLATRIKLSDLRLLRAIVDSGGLARAALHLNMTQPGVSKALAAMERTLGVRLLDRGRAGIAPTRYGEALLSGGLAVFDELRQSVARVLYLADPTTGDLGIGTTQPLALGFIPKVLERMRALHPGIRVHVTEGGIHTQLRQRNIEVGIGRPSVDGIAPDFAENTLFDDPLIVAASVRGPWARRRKLSLRDLQNAPWAIPPYNSFPGELITEAFRAEGLAPPIAQVTTHSLTLAFSLQVAEDYLGITARSVLRLNASNLAVKILPVVLRHRPSPVVIITLKNRSLSPVAELFIRHARQTAMELKLV